MRMRLEVILLLHVRRTKSPGRLAFMSTPFFCRGGEVVFCPAVKPRHDGVIVGYIAHLFRLNIQNHTQLRLPTLHLFHTF